MTTAVMNYMFAPLSGLWSSFGHWFQMIGYSRAAAELARQGYQEESKRLMLELAKIKN
jgi:hypothetical protein